MHAEQEEDEDIRKDGSEISGESDTDTSRQRKKRRPSRQRNDASEEVEELNIEQSWNFVLGLLTLNFKVFHWVSLL